MSKQTLVRLGFNSLARNSPTGVVVAEVSPQQVGEQPHRAQKVRKVSGARSPLRNPGSDHLVATLFTHNFRRISAASGRELTSSVCQKPGSRNESRGRCECTGALMGLLSMRFFSAAYPYIIHFLSFLAYNTEPRGSASATPVAGSSSQRTVLHKSVNIFSLWEGPGEGLLHSVDGSRHQSVLAASKVISCLHRSSGMTGQTQLHCACRSLSHSTAVQSAWPLSYQVTDLPSFAASAQAFSLHIGADLRLPTPDVLVHSRCKPALHATSGSPSSTTGHQQMWPALLISPTSSAHARTANVYTEDAVHTAVLHGRSHPRLHTCCLLALQHSPAHTAFRGPTKVRAQLTCPCACQTIVSVAGASEM